MDNEKFNHTKEKMIDFYPEGIAQFQKWHHPQGNKKVFFLIALPLMSLLVGLLVWQTGGIQYVYSHTSYPIIFLAAYMFGWKGGALIGLLCGFVLGPFMPIDTSTLESQTTLNWLYRLSYFTALGGFFGFVFDLLFKKTSEAMEVTYFNAETQLPNKEYCRVVLWDKLQFEESNSRKHFVVFFIENFDIINSSFGANFSSRFIQDFASVIRKNFEGLDIHLCQLRTNMIGIVYQGDYEKLGKALEKLPRDLNTNQFIGSIPVYYKITAGIYRIRPSDSFNKSFEFALAALNSALEKDKEYELYDSGLSQKQIASVTTIGHIPRAIQQNELYLEYHPIIQASTDQVYAAEALIRWKHPTLGLIPPDQFIPLTEETKMIDLLTEWVITRVKEDIMMEKKDGIPPIGFPISINISHKNLLDAEFLRKLDPVSRSTDFRNQIEFEITERSFIFEPKKIVGKLNILREMGFRVAIDDFGTGYSSLGIIRDLPINYIKIDKLFTQRITSSPKDSLFVKNTIQMIRDLGACSVAEGVEDQPTYNLLKEFGCDFAQGFYFTKPLAINKLLSFWQEYNSQKIIH